MMAGIFGDEINSRADFLREISRAHALVNHVLQSRRGDSVLIAVKTQIEAIQNWTANGRQPTKDEQGRIGMGYRMYREFEGDPDPEIQELRQLVMGIDNYFKYWPSDKDASDEDNDHLLLDD